MSTTLSLSKGTRDSASDPRQRPDANRHVGLTYVEKKQSRLFLWSLGQAFINASQLGLQVPGIASKKNSSNDCDSTEPVSVVLSNQLTAPLPFVLYPQRRKPSTRLGPSKRKPSSSRPGEPANDIRKSFPAFGFSHGSELPITPGVNPIQNAA